MKKTLFNQNFHKNNLSINALLIFFLYMMSLNVSASEPDSGYEITSPISGVIQAVHVQAGKLVKKGDLLLEFDNSLINSNLSEAQALMNLAKINLSEAKKEHERAEELYDRTVLSEHDLQKAKIQYSQAGAKYASSKNKLIHAQWEVTHSKLYAPFPGKVIKVFSFPGQYVNNQLTAQKLMIIEKNK